MKSIMSIKILFLASLVLATSAFADVTLPAIINSKMILQNGEKAPIWGWADSGEKVTVSFAGQSKNTTANSKGKWVVKLDPLAISAKGRTMTIKGKNELKLDDVLVGEVWLASGQSNMEFSIGSIAAKEQAIVSTQINNKLLRMFCTAPKVSSSLPLDDVAGYWSDCSYFIKQMQDKKIRGYDSHSAVAFFFGLKLQQELKIPIAVIDSSWGGTGINAWIADEGYEMENLTLRKLSAKDETTAITDKKALGLLVKEWNKNAQQALKKGTVVSLDLKSPRSRVPNAVYNGMIAPLVPFSIKGTIWYQGESNRGNKDYFQKLKALIGGWSKVFDVSDMPFYLVQMAPYNYAHAKTKNMSHQIIYDSVVSAQYQAAKEIKGCDVITIPDTVFGNVKNVHPDHKKTVGDRLAALALHHDYGKDIICAGPRMTKTQTKGSSVVVSFEGIDKGLETSDGKAPNWFEIAGEDKKFVEATAEIKDNTVIVSSSEVPKPRFIRMAWNNIAELNLRDKNGWPAFSFNTEINK